MRYERLDSEPAPKRVAIAVRQLGLATGKIVLVNRKGVRR